MKKTINYKRMSILRKFSNQPSMMWNVKVKDVIQINILFYK